MRAQNRLLIIRIVLAVVALFAFFLVWDLVAVNDPRPFLPRPFDIFRTLIEIIVTNERDPTGHFFTEHIAASLTRVFYGSAIAALAAIPVGLLSGWSVYAESLSKPIVELIRPIPPFAWIPFAIIFFRDPFSSVFIVYLGAFFPILLTTSAAVKHIDPVLVDVAKTLGAGNWQVFRKVIVPASLPHIVTGLRIGLGIGWMTIIAAELVGVTEGGLGLFIHNAFGDWAQYEKGFAGMFLIGIISFVMISSVVYIERRLSRWAGIL